jgi:hypothetical protein
MSFGKVWQGDEHVMDNLVTELGGHELVDRVEWKKLYLMIGVCFWQFACSKLR